MKSSLLALVIITLPFMANAMNFSSPIQQIKLPFAPSTSQPPTIRYTPPGEISVGVMRMCGDGDVANFETNHKEFQFVPQEKKDIDVLLGYWVVEDGDSISPTPENWFPVGYQKSGIAETPAEVSYTGKFLPINHSSTSELNGLHLVRNELVNIHGQGLKSFEPKKNFRIFVGAFTCLDPDDSNNLMAKTDSNYKFAPMSSEINHVLSSNSGLIKTLEDGLSLLDVSTPAKVDEFIAASSKIKGAVSASPGNDSIVLKSSIATVENPYQFTIAADGAVDLTGGALLAIFKDVANLSYPVIEPSLSEADKLKAYVAAMKALAIFDKFKDLDKDKSAYCKSLLIAVNQESAQYRWEAFPMNSSCRFLHGKSTNDELLKAFGKVFNPATLPTVSDFESNKKKLASRFFVAQAYETVQKSLQANTDLKLARSSCFTKGQPLINRLVGSYPFQFVLDKADKRYEIVANKLDHIHPEPGFAIYDYTRYFSDDRVAVWGQINHMSGLTVDDKVYDAWRDWGIELPLQDSSKMNDQMIENSSFNGAPVNIFFKIRSVGGSCTMYC